MKRFIPIFCLIGVLVVAGALIYPRWHQRNLDAALLQAVAANNGGEATFLVEDGADVNSHGPLNWTPLMQAAMNGKRAHCANAVGQRRAFGTEAAHGQTPRCMSPRSKGGPTA